MLYTKAMKTKSGKICRSEEWYHTFRYFHSRMVKQKHVLEDIPRSVKMMALMQAFYFFQFSCNREVLFVSPSWETSLPRSHGNHHPTKDKDNTTPCFSATSFRKPPFQLLSLNQIQTWKPTRNLRVNGCHLVTLNFSDPKMLPPHRDHRGVPGGEDWRLDHCVYLRS